MLICNKTFWMFFFILPKNRLAPNVLRLQRSSLQEFVAEAVVEGAVKAGGTSVRVQHSKALHLVFPVDQQLRFVAVNPDQDHVLHHRTHVAAEELVGDSIREKLKENKTI